MGKQEKFEIHLIDILQQQRLQTKVSFLIVDSKVSLVEEPIKSNSNNALTLATYSNSDSTVITYTELKICHNSLVNSGLSSCASFQCYSDIPSIHRNKLTVPGPKPA
jgi:hypothetical protein